MERFVITFKENLWSGQDFTSSVWGTGKFNESIADTGTFYIALSNVDQDVLDIVEKYIASKDFRELPEYKWNWYMWSISELLLSKQEL